MTGDFLRPVEDISILIRHCRPIDPLGSPKGSLTALKGSGHLHFNCYIYFHSKMDYESSNNSTENIDPDGLVHSHEGRQLPPVDGGKDAWMFLVAGFIIEGLTWGLC
jgi:hypothetical protein